MIVVFWGGGEGKEKETLRKRNQGPLLIASGSTDRLVQSSGPTKPAVKALLALVNLIDSL